MSKARSTIEEMSGEYYDKDIYYVINKEHTVADIVRLCLSFSSRSEVQSILDMEPDPEKLEKIISMVKTLSRDRLAYIEKRIEEINP